MNLSTKQSEINEMTENLKMFSALVDLYGEDRADKDIFLSELSRFEGIDWAEENMFNQLMAYNALGTAYGNLKIKELDYTKAYYDNEFIYRGISYYHNLQYVVARIANEEWAALYYTTFKLCSRAYMCIANAYDHIGRFCEAQQYYKLASLDKGVSENVEINQGFSLANTHSFYVEEEPWAVRKAQQLMRKHASSFKRLAPELTTTVCGWLAPSFDVPLADFSNIENGEYEKWTNENFLRLNRFCDIEQYSRLSLLDNVKLPDITESEERKKVLESSFEEIRKIFIDTREILYSSLIEKENIKSELLKMSYRNLYSIFDKIAVFLKVYLRIPVKVYKADFASIWYDNEKNIREEFHSRTDNLSLLALYNVSMDVYGNKKLGYVIDEQTKDFQRIRNFIEHKIVRIQDGPMHYDEYQLTISMNELTINTIRLAQLARCAIIYLCNFVIHAEYDRNCKMP